MKRPSSPRTLPGFNNSPLGRVAIAAFLLVAVAHLWSHSASAAILTWDSGDVTNGPIIDPASGTWDTNAGNLVWNDGVSNFAWTQTNPTTPLNSAVFNGADGAY